MRKLSESIWSDIQDRSSGNSIRKEDDVNLMSMEDFCDYLNNNYISKDGHKIYYDGIGKRLYIAVLKKFVNVNYVITYDYNTNTIYANDEIEDFVPELCQKLKNNFKVVKKNVGDTYTEFIIYPSDGSECTNRFFVDVLDFIIENEDEDKVILAKKHINESIWSDIQDRSSGETVRKEDDVNNLDMNGLYDHIYGLYEQINPFPMPLKSLEDTSDKKTQYFSIPIFKVSYKVYRLDAIFTNNKISTLVLMASDANIRDFKQALIDNFDVIIRSDTALTIEEKDGTLTNQTCMKLISVIVENAPEPYLIKKREN